MIVVTGASGKTGHAVVKALADSGQSVRALARRAEQVDPLLSLGAKETLVGDMLDPTFFEHAFQGVQAVYHICPNMSPDEVTVAEYAIVAAKKGGVEHFVYHSVLHPQVEAMPHHWLKMRVEEKLFTAGQPFTILQPCAYMQNVLAYWPSITHEGIYPVPYAVSARISIVDLEDVAAVAARVVGDPGHYGAVYELAGPEPLSQSEVAEIIGRALGRTVTARAVDRGEWEKRARASEANQMNPNTVDTLLKMFVYYENYGLTGSQNVLQWLLGRPPVCFSEFVNRNLRSAQING
jgi:NAD(P)H dehydrogenase (quinone)